MPKIRRAQQHREHFAVFVRRDLILPQQQPDLVQQIDHDIPFTEHFFGSGNALLVPQSGRQIVHGSLRPQIFQKEINALRNAHGRFAAAGLDKFFHGRDQLLTRLLRQSQILLVIMLGVAIVAGGRKRKFGAPVFCGKRPCIGIVFQSALLFLA